MWGGWVGVGAVLLVFPARLFFSARDDTLLFLSACQLAETVKGRRISMRR